MPRASVTDLYLTKCVVFTMCHLLLTHLILLITGETDLLLFCRGESTQRGLVICLASQPVSGRIGFETRKSGCKVVGLTAS